MLTAAQRSHFAGQGWLRVPSVVPSRVLSTAAAATDRFTRDPQPGPRFAFPSFSECPELAALWRESAAPEVVAELIDAVIEPVSCQLAMTFPPFPRGAGRPHIDGTAGEVGGRPGTFSLLVGFPLSDQSQPGMGGLWVWPGSHLEHAAHFARNGPTAFWDGDPGYPDVATAAPVQILSEPGDLVLAHYLLGHCPGGVEDVARMTMYLRLESAGHAANWHEAMTDVSADFTTRSSAVGCPTTDR